MALTEDQIIDLFRPLAKHPGAFGLIDDCAAVTPPPGCDLVLKADAIIGTVHFLSDDPADDIARKALRVNLSDLAAKGAEPIGFLISLALPKETTAEWLAAFARGLGEDAQSYDCPLLGGDTDHTPGPAMVSIAVFGTVPAGTMVRRDAARAGDRIVVTGSIGDAALGLRLSHEARLAERWQLDAAQSHHLIDRYRRPQPRNAIADALRTHARAGMDISDGLVGDLSKLCRASSVSAEIEAAKVPLSAAARGALNSDPALIEPMLTGGDDYEVLATLPAEAVVPLQAVAGAAGVAVTEIGRIVAGQEPPRVIGTDDTVLSFKQGSYSHF